MHLLVRIFLVNRFSVNCLSANRLSANKWWAFSINALFSVFYETFQKREHYSLLAKKIEATAQGKRRRRMSENVSDEAVEARWHRNFASKLMQK